jgi:hypothetical protein
MKNPTPNLPIGRVARTMIIILVALIVVVAIVIPFSNQFYYLFARVNQNQVGVRFQGGRILDVVGPGVYSDIGFFVEIQTVSSQAVPFSVRDEEIITSDKQRIGLVVSGDIFRPDLARRDLIITLWPQYGNIYLDDELAKTRVQDLTRQAMKVCVGERIFDEAIIGNARDDLRACIDDELSQLAGNYGLQIENVVVPEVVLSPEVQAALDSIVQSRLATEKAAQDKLKADAEAAAAQAQKEGEIRVAQAGIQEEARQQTTLAQLELERLQAQQAVIEAQKANELLAAEQDLAIQEALALAAVERAKVDLAEELLLAEIYANNPDYLQLQIVLANAAALKPTDKIIFTLEGSTPTIVIPGPGIVPTVDTAPTDETIPSTDEVSPQ